MVCDMDCANCIHPDCINDELSLDEYKLDIVKQPETKGTAVNRERSKLRMRSIREANPNLAKEYYINNRERELTRNAQWKKDNKDYVNAYQRERYEKNREEMCRKRREYKARKKAERVS